MNVPDVALLKGHFLSFKQTQPLEPSVPSSNVQYGKPPAAVLNTSSLSLSMKQFDGNLTSPIEGVDLGGVGPNDQASAPTVPVPVQEATSSIGSNP